MKYVSRILFSLFLAAPFVSKAQEYSSETIPVLLFNAPILTKTFVSEKRSAGSFSEIIATTLYIPSVNVNIDTDSSQRFPIQKDYPDLKVPPLKVSFNDAWVDVITWNKLPFVQLSFCYIDTSNTKTDNVHNCRFIGHGKYFSIYSLNTLLQRIEGKSRDWLGIFQSSEIRRNGTWKNSGGLIKNESKNLSSFLIFLESTLDHEFEQHDEICRNCMVLGY